MRLNVKKWGNSQGIRLPKELINNFHLENGGYLELATVNYEENIVSFYVKNAVDKPKQRLTLQERLANTEEITYLQDWEESTIVGEEII